MFGKRKEGSGVGKFMRKTKESPVESWVQKYKDAKNLNQGLCVLVLAAGSGQRMNSDLPLVPRFSPLLDSVVCILVMASRYSTLCVA